MGLSYVNEPCYCIFEIVKNDSQWFFLRSRIRQIRIVSGISPRLTTNAGFLLHLSHPQSKSCFTNNNIINNY